MPRQSKAERRHHWKPTPETLASIEKLEKHRLNSRKKLETGSKSFIHDKSSPSYSWLLPGWLAEERVVTCGRVYRYYYDPNGNQYRAKYEVLDSWEKLGLVVLDL